MKRFVWLAFLGFAAFSPLAAQDIKLRATIECERECSTVAFSPDGKCVAGGSRDATRIWDISSGKVLATFRDPVVEKRLQPVAAACSLAFSPDGKVLAIGAGNHEAPEVRLWDVATGKNTLTLKSQAWPRDPSESVNGPRVFRSVAFSPDGTILAAGGGYGPHGETRLWDATTGRNWGELPGSSWEINSVAFSPDGKLLASAGNTLTLCVLATGAKPAALLHKTDSRLGKLKVVYNNEKDFGFFACVAFSPDGKTLATAGWDDLTIMRWDAASGKRLATLRGHVGYVAYVAFLPDGSTLLSAGNDDDGSIRLWDVATGKNTVTVFVNRTDGLRGLALSPDGKTLASAAGEDQALGRKNPLTSGSDRGESFNVMTSIWMSKTCVGFQRRSHARTWRNSRIGVRPALGTLYGKVASAGLTPMPTRCRDAFGRRDPCGRGNRRSVFPYN